MVGATGQNALEVVLGAREPERERESQRAREPEREKESQRYDIQILE